MKLETASTSAPKTMPAMVAAFMPEARSALASDSFNDLFNPNLQWIVATGKARKPNDESLILLG